jgi:hypothetical protein
MLDGTRRAGQAMVLRGSMDLRVYDRLFPNQDVLPEGGFGMWVATSCPEGYRGYAPWSVTAPLSAAKAPSSM